jgi:hypothetical protein
MLTVYVGTYWLARQLYKAVPWQSGQYVERDSADCLRIQKPRGKTRDIFNMQTAIPES